MLTSKIVSFYNCSYGNIIIDSNLTIVRGLSIRIKETTTDKKGFMDGNLAATVYYNFGEIGDWLNEPSRSGVWPKGTNHTYVDGVALLFRQKH